MSHRIFYIDLFEPTNSNFYWRDAFRRRGPTRTFDTRKRKENLKNQILKFQPTHIHLGGSVKPGRSVAAALLRDVKEQLGCGISVFYGDRPFSEYHSRLARVVDFVYISNKTHIRTNARQKHPNFRYLPCPTEPRIFSYQPSERIYDVVFAGWNNDTSRYRILDEINKRYKLVVAGPNWKGSNFKSVGPAFNNDFAKLCGKTKIMLSLIGDKWRSLEGYFSNRLPNVMGSRCFLIQTHSEGIEDLFVNHRHLVWYRADHELYAMIDFYLKNSKDREQIALDGQKEILRSYTFDHHVKKMLKECYAANQPG